MKKDEFVKLYNSTSIFELCKMLNCSQTVIYRTLKEYQIPLKKGKKRLIDNEE